MSNPTHPASRVIETSILISAPLSTVRTVLLDFAAYPAWSSFITTIQPPSTAQVKVGDALTVTLNPPGGSTMTMTPTVVLLDDHAFGWQGHLAGITGLFDGKHLFLLKEQEQGSTLLVQREEFGGILYAPLMNWLGMGEKTKNGFELYNQAVKKRAEELARAHTQGLTNT